ncbi:hypothetical protein CRUP_031425, partial [Coryphaenoides rupestris]
MMGGMLAGHDQCAGEVIERDGKKVKLFYGMSSDTAMKKYVGGVAEYGVGGPHGGGAVPRRRGGDGARRAGRPALHLHVRGRRQAEGAEPPHHVHPRHAAGQPHVRLAWTWLITHDMRLIVFFLQEVNVWVHLLYSSCKILKS